MKDMHCETICPIMNMKVVIECEMDMWMATYGASRLDFMVFGLHTAR